MKENICTHKRRRTSEKKNKQGDKEHVTGNVYFKIYKIFLIKIGWSCKKNAKPTNVKTLYSSYTGRNKEKRRDKVEEDLTLILLTWRIW